MSKHLAAENVDIRISHAEFDIDGGLSIRLANVPLLGDGRPAESIERIVRETEAHTRRTCQMCGDLAITYGEPGQVPFVQRVVCFDHKTETETADPPARTGTGLPRHLRNDRVRVEPGWYPIVVELDQQIAAVADHVVESCTQEIGRLKFVPSFPETLPHDAARRVRELINDASMRAETTCEHCGSEGTRSDQPWIHVCCEHCNNTRALHRPN